MNSAGHDPKSTPSADETGHEHTGATVEQPLPGGLTLRYTEASESSSTLAGGAPLCPLCERAPATRPKDDPLVCETCRLSRQSETQALTARRRQERLAALADPSVPLEAALGPS